MSKLKAYQEDKELGKTRVPDVNRLPDALFKLERNIDLLSVVQSAITEAPYAIEEKSINNALFEIVLNFTEAFEDIKKYTNYS